MMVVKCESYALDTQTWLLISHEGITVVCCVIAELTVKISEIQSLVVFWALDVFMVHVNHYKKKERLV